MRRAYSVNVRLNEREYSDLTYIVRARQLDNISEAVREAITFYASVLRRVPSNAGSLVINNLVVNMNISQGREVREDKELKYLRRKVRMYERMIDDYEKEISRLSRELEASRQRIKDLEDRLRSLSIDSIKAKVLGTIKSRIYQMVKTGKVSREELPKLLEVVEEVSR